MSEKDGGPAFPSEGEGHGNPKYHSPGMSLRDYFAAAALTGIMARMHESIQHVGSDTFPSNISTHAYRIADALLKARTQGES